MKRGESPAACGGVPLLFVLIAITYFPSEEAQAQGPQVGGHIITPGVGESFQLNQTVRITWEIDNPTDLSSQDITLSTDGGFTFDLTIALNLPGDRRDFEWAVPPVATSLNKAKVAVHIRDKKGNLSHLISGAFSIVVTGNPQVGTQATNLVAKGIKQDAKSLHKAQPVSPNFAPSGPCLNSPPSRIIEHYATVPCSGPYGGEPALAFDPTDSSHFHVVTGSRARMNITGVSSTSGGTAITNTINSGTISSRGDLTTEIASNGKVFIVGLGTTRADAVPNKLLVYRSTDGGATFPTPITVPNLPVLGGDSFVDKPVVAIHPTNPDILVITFQQLDAAFHLTASWVAICNGASSATNLGSASIWSVQRPIDEFGNLLPPVNSTHPLIDPISPTSTNYWLFIVQTNADSTTKCNSR